MMKMNCMMNSHNTNSKQRAVCRNRNCGGVTACSGPQRNGKLPHISKFIKVNKKQSRKGQKASLLAARKFLLWAAIHYCTDSRDVGETCRS